MSSPSTVTSAKTTRWRRYLPLVIWMAVIFFASTGEFSAANTNLLIKPLLRWFFPNLSNEQVQAFHFFIRKCAHFTEYAILGWLVARAFIASSGALRRHWLADGVLFIAVYALSDEFHQSFVASRTASIYDSLIDMSGGIVALVLIAIIRWRRQRREIQPQDL